MRVRELRVGDRDQEERDGGARAVTPTGRSSGRNTAASQVRNSAIWENTRLGGVNLVLLRMEASTSATSEVQLQKRNFREAKSN